jgi:hypothetical protein
MSMDYFQGVVAEYLRANRSTFVNPEFWFSLDGNADAAPKNTSWFVDVLAVNFEQRCVFLCEVTFSKTPYALLKRLGTWAENWPKVTAAIRRDAKIPGDWNIIPWVFVPEPQIAAIRDRLPRFPGMPPITALEDTLPWKYRTWDRRTGDPVMEFGAEC